VIYTFYSYKGGVGRSMALANVAELFCAKKLDVLMVDFDLEAPGLERYVTEILPTDTGLAAVQEHPGVIDLIASYSKLRSLSPSRVLRDDARLEDRIAMLPRPTFGDFVIDIRKKQPGRGRLALMTAGSRSGERYESYAQQILSFSWSDFFLHQEGELFFEWFRQEAEAIAEVVLIDSRTGVTEMSGVCTHQLADVVVSFVAANQQNQQGVLRTARSLAAPDLISKGRHDRKLAQVLVPSRLEIAEGDQAKEFQTDLESLLAESFPSGLPGQGTITFDLAIPYVPYFAFKERVAVRELSHPLAKLIAEPIERLAKLMAKFAPVNSITYLSYHSSTEHLAKICEQLAETWTPEVTARVRAVLGRLVHVATASKRSTFSPRTVPMEEMGTTLSPVVGQLVAAGVLSLDPVSEGVVTVSLADPNLFNEWSRLRGWLDEDAPFLAWLPRVSAGRAEWEQTRKTEDLLSGTPLEEARRWLAEKPGVLNEKELAYVAESQIEETRRLAAQEIAIAKQTAVLEGAGGQAPLLTAIRMRDRNVAIVFIHGFGGGPETTWGKFPAFLADDRRLSDWDIFSVGYASRLEPDIVGIWRANAPIDRLAVMFRTACITPPLSRYKSLALIAHSMGGLVVQRALVDSSDVAARVSDLFMFGTPSAGLRRAGLFSFLKRQVRDLTERSEFIVDLRVRWTERFGERPPFRCFRAIAGDQDEFVPSSSSLDPFAPDQRFVVPGNHLQVVKPSTPDNLAVRLVVEGISGGAGPSDSHTTALRAIESRQFARAIDALWPHRDELDDQGLVDLALALEQMGRQADAINILRTRSRDDLDATGVLAGRLKRRWLAERRRKDADDALELYSTGLRLAEERNRHDQALYHGVNKAFMQIAYSSDLEAARETARRVLEHCAKSQRNVWTLAAQGEAQLLLGHTSEALSSYQQAVFAMPQPRQLDSMYQQAIRLADLIADEDALRALPTIFSREPVPDANQAPDTNQQSPS